jgi:hypothetical protein
MRLEKPAGDALPVSRNGERTLPASRRIEHGAEDGRRNRANPAGRHEARELFEADQSGTGGIPGRFCRLAVECWRVCHATGRLDDKALQELPRLALKSLNLQPLRRDRMPAMIAILKRSNWLECRIRNNTERWEDNARTVAPTFFWMACTKSSLGLLCFYPYWL